MNVHVSRSAFAILGTLVLATATNASAQTRRKSDLPAEHSASPDLASGHSVLLGVESVMGFEAVYVTTKQEAAGRSQEVKTSTTSLGLLGERRADFAADAFLADHITLGGSLSYASGSGTQESSGTKTDLDSESVWRAGPRVGFYAPVAPALAFWLRGGVEYVRDSTESTLTGGSKSTTTVSLTQLAISPALLWFVAPHLAINFAATAKTIVASSYDVSPAPALTPSTSYSGQVYNVTVGLTGAL